MPRAARPCLQLPRAGQACPKQGVSPHSARLSLTGLWTRSHLHVHRHSTMRIVVMTDKLADLRRCSRAEHSKPGYVLHRVSAAALSASEPAACTQSRVAQHAQHSSAPDMSCSPPNGKMSSLQPSPPSPDLPSIAAEGSTPGQCQSFPSWLAQQVSPADPQCICCDPRILVLSHAGPL